MPKTEIVNIPSHRQSVQNHAELERERHRHNWSMSKLIQTIVDIQIQNGFKDVRAIYGKGKDLHEKR